MEYILIKYTLIGEIIVISGRKEGVKIKRREMYDIVTVKLLLFSYNIYLFNVLFLSYKPSFVFCTWKYPKRQSTVRHSDISFLLHLSFARTPALLSLSYCSAIRFFLLLAELLCGLMNTGGAFNDRSIHTMNAGCHFYYYLAVRNNRASYRVFSLCYAISSLVEFCQIIRNTPNHSWQSDENRQISFVTFGTDTFCMISLFEFSSLRSQN